MTIHCIDGTSSENAAAIAGNAILTEESSDASRALRLARRSTRRGVNVRGGVVSMSSTLLSCAAQCESSHLTQKLFRLSIECGGLGGNRYSMTQAQSLRTMLSEDRLLMAAGAYDVISARLVEEAGFPLVYYSG